VDPLRRGDPGETVGTAAATTGDESHQPPALAHLALQESHRRHDLFAGEDAGAMEARTPARCADAEVAQHCTRSAADVQGVGTEVEVEAVVVASSGATAELRRALDHHDTAAVAGERCSSGQPCEAAADDDGGKCVHAISTIHRRTT